MANKPLKSIKFPGLSDTYTVPEVDSTLTGSGKAADAKAVGDKLGDLKSAFDDIVNITESKNLLNPANIIEGKFYKAQTVDGRAMMILSDNDAYSCAYIDIVQGDSYSISGISYTTYNGDADGYAIGIACSTGTSITNPTLDTSAVQSSYGNTDKTITRLYFSWRHAAYPIDTYMANAGQTLLPYEPYSDTPVKSLSPDVRVPQNNIVPEVYTVDISGNGDYTSFSACLTALKDNTNEKTIYVKPGTYDVFAEIGGADYAQSISDHGYNWWDVSVVVPPHTKIIGIGEAVLEFKPTSAQIPTDVMSLLSPVNVVYDVYMENITVDCDNCRYGIHDETGHEDNNTGTRHIYKNVRINKIRTDGGMDAAFGCGMQKSQYMEFDSCVFASPNRPFSFHNKGTPVDDYTDGTIIVIKNCASIPNNSTTGNALRFGNVNGKQVKIDARVFNSYLGGQVWIGNESSTERPNAYALTLVRSGNPTITIESQTNIYTPAVYQ